MNSGTFTFERSTRSPHWVVASGSLLLFSVAPESGQLQSIFLSRAHSKHRPQPAVPMSMMHIGRVRVRMCQPRMSVGVRV